MGRVTLSAIALQAMLLLAAEAAAGDPAAGEPAAAGVPAGEPAAAGVPVAGIPAGEPAAAGVPVAGIPAGEPAAAGAPETATIHADPATGRGSEDLIASPRPGSRETDPFQEAILLMESSDGAYAPGLSEQLLSMGLALQHANRHEEAVKVFKRGAHLTRINNGLHGAEQIPLVSGEIRSRLALGQYTEADERQQYLYRVQVRSMNSGAHRAMALMQQANWQYNAYQLGLGDAGYPRLANMWDLYRLALNDVISTEGETSPALLQPLTGMLQAQYLIAGWRGDTQTQGFSSGDTYSDRQDQNRFYAYRSQSYQKGQAVIQAIYDIEREKYGEDSVEALEALVMLGDWFQWHGERDEAAQVYREALVELMALENAQTEVDRVFGEPVPLPDLEGVRPLPATGEAGPDHILLEFGVTERGRVVDMERLDENESIDGKASRLMRQLRSTTFRPRFEAGEPVATEKLVRAYEVIQ